MLAPKLKVFLVIALVVVGLGGYAYYAFNLGTKGVQKGEVVNLAPKSSTKTTENTGAMDYQIVEFTRGLYVPWSMVFTSNERILVSERSGSVREVVNGLLTPKPLIILEETEEVSESGLMGITIHPNYALNKFVYACITYSKENSLVDKVERFIDNGKVLAREKVIFDDIPAARNHAGCRIKFGPDGKLFITSGDAQTKKYPQDLDSLAGKILRINDDGSVPADNPFTGSAVWSYGHRNPQGIAWHPSGVMFETEHGPSGNDGPGGGDEVNIIKKGANYGWPQVSHTRSAEGMESPKLVFTPAEAPAGATFYSGKVFPQFKNNFFFTALRGAGIFRVVVSDNNPEEIVSYEKMDIDFGRIRDVIEGPDGLIYFTTSNKDGRGTARDGDDKIYRFEPK